MFLNILGYLLVAILGGVTFVSLLTQFFYWYEYKNNPHALLSGHKVTFWHLFYYTFESTLSILIIYIFYPFAAISSKPPLNPNTNKPPLILVHGLYHNASAWLLYKHWFKKTGYERVYAFSYPTRGQDIWSLTSHLEKKVAELELLYPNEKPIVLAMSLGGLITRAWMSESISSGAVINNTEHLRDGHSNQNRLAGVLTLGTPHSGSRLGAFGLEKTAKSLLPTDQFFAELIAREALVKGAWIPKLALYSVRDNMVLPLDNLLPPADWSRNILAEVTHVAMILCKRSFNITLAALENIQACPAPALVNEEGSDSSNDEDDKGGESTSNKAVS